MEKKNATDISKKLLNTCPNIKYFLEILMKDIDIKTEKVGNEFQYPKSVTENQHQSLYGLIIQCFVCKHLSNQFSIQLKDENTEIVLNNVDKYFITKIKNKTLMEDISHHYNIFRDSKTQAMDIVPSIKKVALSTALYFHDPIPTNEIEVNNENLIEIVRYFKKLNYSKAEMKCDIGCNYFDGSSDVIFDNRVMYEIKNLQFGGKIGGKFFYKMILYAFGYYKKTGAIIKCFKIYNPLKGLQYEMEIDDIDMVQFESALKKDLEKI